MYVKPVYVKPVAPIRPPPLITGISTATPSGLLHRHLKPPQGHLAEDRGDGGGRQL